MTTVEGPSRATKVVVATTVMLSFITFWRAAAIVLCDLASSAFYAGGISETFVGKPAPWFIFAIMLFSYAVRAIYIEGCSMFVRGGVYKVVQAALGDRLAKFAVSALMFDYVLTGPISGVSAGLYLAGLINETAEHFHSSFRLHPAYFACVFTIAVTLYFWRKNIIGIHESSQKALRIMQMTTVMVVILIVWCLVTIVKQGFQPVPLPAMANLKFSDEALGWLKGTHWPSIPLIAILIGLGHSLLAMSGEESLAQVNREIAAPKLKNLERAGAVIFVYSMLFTSLVSFFAVMLIPDQERTKVFIDNLIGGLAMNVVGPVGLKLLFHGFVVVVGTVILAGAVNTAIVGSNGVLNRVAEDGVLADWFRKPHRKYGTSSRIITLIVALQIATILITRGDLKLLGDAYAFGVVWSFAMKSLSVLVLRYRRPNQQEWKVPLNFRFRGVEIPVGLILISLTLFSLAIVNLFTKETATIWGSGFTVAIYIVFEASERYNRRRAAMEPLGVEKFTLETSGDPTEGMPVRPGNVLVPVRNPHLLDHVRKVLEKKDTRKIDIVILTVKKVTDSGAGEHDLTADQIFSTDVADIFSKVVSLAEKAGKHVELLVVPGVDVNLAIVETARRLQSSLIVMGLSARMTPAEQAKQFGDAFELLPPPRPQVSLEIFNREENRSLFFNLGPHPPRLWPEDVDLLHRLWLELSSKELGHKLHHRDVVRVALRRLDADLRSDRSEEVLRDVNEEASEGKLQPSVQDATESGGR